MANSLIDLTGQRFGKLTAAWPAGIQGRRIKWLCFCDCGQHIVTRAYNLKSGETKSCGCLHIETAREAGKARVRHGHTSNGYISPEYHSFRMAKNRCTNIKCASWPDYGGRGIEFRFDSFEEFLFEVGLKPEPKRLYSVDRINNDGHYEPGNVKWSTRSEQNRNKRPHRRSRLVAQAA